MKHVREPSPLKGGRREWGSALLLLLAQVCGSRRRRRQPQQNARSVDLILKLSEPKLTACEWLPFAVMFFSVFFILISTFCTLFWLLFYFATPKNMLGPTRFMVIDRL